MPKFLIDANLPYYFHLWNSDDYIHQADINPKATDKEIWEYARLHDLIIITKDADFSNRIILESPPPKVIHIRFGNLKMKDFHKHMTKVWETSIVLLENNKLVNIGINKIEGIK